MNLLEIVQKLHSETQSGSGARPTSTVSQVGDIGRLVDWAINSHNDIQQRHPNWKWMRSTYSLATVADDGSYAYGDCTDTRLTGAITRFKQWWPFDQQGYQNTTIYKSSDGVASERYLPFMPWANFRSMYLMGTQNSGVPAHFSVDPQHNLRIGPKPDGVYVIQGEYQLSNKVLAVDADEPEFHSDWHMLVVYNAMEKYGASKIAVEVYNRAQIEGGRLMRSLELRELPEMMMAGPLA